MPRKKLAKKTLGWKMCSDIISKSPDVILVHDHWLKNCKETIYHKKLKQVYFSYQ